MQGVDDALNSVNGAPWPIKKESQQVDAGSLDVTFYDQSTQFRRRLHCFITYPLWFDHCVANIDVDYQVEGKNQPQRDIKHIHSVLFVQTIYPAP